MLVASISADEIDAGLTNAATSYPTVEKQCLAMSSFVEHAGQSEFARAWGCRAFSNILERVHSHDLSTEDGWTLVDKALQLHQFGEYFIEK